MKHLVLGLSLVVGVNAFGIGEECILRGRVDKITILPNRTVKFTFIEKAKLLPLAGKKATAVAGKVRELTMPLHGQSHEICNNDGLQKLFAAQQKPNTYACVELDPGNVVKDIKTVTEKSLLTKPAPEAEAAPESH